MIWITRGIVLLLIVAFSAANVGGAQADNTDREIALLRATIEDLLARDETREAELRSLRDEISHLKGEEHAGHSSHDDHDDHAHDDGAHDGHDDHGTGGDLYRAKVGDATLRFSALTVDTALVAGYSSESTQEEIATLQGGGHDPIQNGFTLRTVDLGLIGGLDPYFDAETHIAFLLDAEGETKIELEEAFLRTQSLPAGFEVEAGHMFTEFGAFNPLHVHDWSWLDQPVIATRLLGPDGARAPGVRVGWTLPGTDRTRLHFGMQNATGETMVSFLANDEFYEERPIGGLAFRGRDVDDLDEFVYLGRFETGGGDNRHNVKAGASLLAGPNASGPDGYTLILGADLGVRLALSSQTDLTWTTEFMYRDFQSDDLDDGTRVDDLEDYGFYSEVLLGLSETLSGGVRAEYVSGDGESIGDFAGRDEDPFRDDRFRVSPLLAWAFAPSGYLTLQYNYDDADHLDLAGDSDAHAIWLGLNWNISAGRAAHDHH